MFTFEEKIEENLRRLRAIQEDVAGREKLSVLASYLNESGSAAAQKNYVLAVAWLQSFVLEMVGMMVAELVKPGDCATISYTLGSIAGAARGIANQLGEEAGKAYEFGSMIDFLEGALKEEGPGTNGAKREEDTIAASIAEAAAAMFHGASGVAVKRMSDLPPMLREILRKIARTQSLEEDNPRLAYISVVAAAGCDKMPIEWKARVETLKKSVKAADALGTVDELLAQEGTLNELKELNELHDAAHGYDQTPSHP